ncbi:MULTISPECIES: lysylphosphatidylglycerol synthase transmembrane domain-containing protein [Mesobacillus]|uniref:lysylphosphatidylglycerol synthase transmembrane domain-containing protein n=1 Tax=Mesobacillus TaxID=2675231 RepID=UPI0017859980|nr:MULTISPECIES: lysylphosphatidylglycerol synthase transmembrane domain-containing protein [Mesobacillus]MCM3572120.1 flippase-like domain-containing protein [Mesobacillus subterraneus]UYZ20986.1 flippase-like domain-containing protein [Mesobacillus jeotgali]
MKTTFKKLISILLITAFLIMTFYYLDAGMMIEEIKAIATKPGILLLIFSSYFLAFLARGAAWKLYLNNRVRLTTCMYGLFYSLLLNHLLPVKAGDFARIGVLKAREPDITGLEAFNSVIVLRVMDTIILFGMASAGLAFLELPLNGKFFVWLGVSGVVVTIILYYKFRAFFDRQLTIMKNAFIGWRGIWIIMLTLISWILEAAVIYGVVLNGGSNISFVQAIWVNSITVAGQIFQITPGGIASYEAIMVFALGANGIAPENAYTAAVITHGLKYLFSFIVGGIALAAYPVPAHLLKKWTRERGNEL